MHAGRGKVAVIPRAASARTAGHPARLYRRRRPERMHGRPGRRCGPRAARPSPLRRTHGFEICHPNLMAGPERAGRFVAAEGESVIAPRPGPCRGDDQLFPSSSWMIGASGSPSPSMTEKWFWSGSSASRVCVVPRHIAARMRVWQRNSGLSPAPTQQVTGIPATGRCRTALSRAASQADRPGRAFIRLCRSGRRSCRPLIGTAFSTRPQGRGIKRAVVADHPGDKVSPGQMAGKTDRPRDQGFGADLGGDGG